MADRYWVGGSGNWSDTNRWSASSGGSGGASVPTSVDNVIFDAGSNVGTGAFTVTVDGTSSSPSQCLDFSTGGAGGALDGAMTLSMGATAVLECYGSMTLPSTNLTWSGTAGAELSFRATTTGKTITTNGVSLANTGVTFNGSGGGWTLGSAITTTSGGITLTAGSVNTGNYNITSPAFVAGSGSGTRSLTLGTSTVTLSLSGTAFSYTGTNFTLTANTSQITCSGASPTFNGGGLTFYNVTFSSAANGTTTINGANTFNNLTQTSRSATGVRIVVLGDNQTVSNVLTIGAANTAIRRLQVTSSSVGTQRTITLNGSLATLADVDFRDIATAGTVGTWTGTRIGNGLNNSGITFDAPKTVYWNLAGTQAWSATGWATTNNGTPAVNNFPLAQDTATFTEAGAAGTVDYNFGFWVGDIQMADGVSNRTTAFTLTVSSGVINIFKNVTLFSNLTTSGTGTFIFRGQGTTQVLDVNTATFVPNITIDSPGGTFQIAENTTCSGTITHTSGTVDLNNLTLTCLIWSSSNSNARSIAFGTTGQITVTGNNATVWTTATATGFSYTGTSTVNFTYSGSTGTRTLSVHSTAGGTEANALNFNVSAGTDSVAISSGSVFKNLIFTGFAGNISNATGKLVYGNLIISSGMTLVAGTSGFSFVATSGTQQITTNGVTLDFPITQNSPGATLQLQDNLTIGSTRTFTLTAGTLDLSSGNRTLSTGIFSSTNSNTRAISFGIGNITVTGNDTTVFAFGTTTNFTYTGTSNFIFNYAGSTGTRTISLQQTGITENNALNINITAGTDIVTFGATRFAKNLNFTGFSGTVSNTGTLTLYGNLIVSAGLTWQSSTNAISFGSTSGTQQITTNGNTLDCPITANAPGATVQLQDALTMGSTRTLTLTAGTLDVNNKNVTTGLFNGSGTTARTLTMGSGTWAITGAGSAWDLTTTTNLTLNENTSTINLTSSSAKTFAGGDQNYYNLNLGGTGDLTIQGSNVFNEISDSIDGSTVYFTAGTTTTTSFFTVDGASGNLILLRSTTPGSIWNLVQSSGSVGITYVDIQDSNASGGATFQCINGVNSGNNTGWTFVNSGFSSGNFLIFF